MTFAEFQSKAESAGLRARNCGNGHWQLTNGTTVVNYYPSRGTVYVKTMGRGRRGHSPEQAIAIALNPQSQAVGQKPGSKSMQARWEQHRRDGGVLTFEQFKRRAARRKSGGGGRYPHAIPKAERIALAEQMFDDMPDGAFFAASMDVFGLDVDDFVD